MIAWIKRNKLAALLSVIVGYFVITYFISPQLNFRSNMNKGISDEGIGMSAKFSRMQDAITLESPVPNGDFAPQSNVSERLVVSESILSLLVNDVVDVKNKIVKYAKDSGGYMVDANISNPQDAPTGVVAIRVPSAKLDDALIYLRSLAVKVVSENLNGQDVTDEYVDVEARIAILEKTNARFEAILNQAAEISDITNLNQQIINIQSQIDSLRGQQDAIKKKAELSKITAYLSTDEMALPYAPSETFRPAVIFKQAVRSLVGLLRRFATFAIWLGVYAIIWIPVLFIIYFIKNKLTRKP